MKTLIILIASTFLLSACGTAWVIRRSTDGGVIGYKNYPDGDQAAKAVQKLIHCPNYEIVNDELYTSQGTAIMPMQSTTYSSGTVYGAGYRPVNYYGQQTQTNYVPVSVQQAWREATYRCENKSLHSQFSKPEEPAHEAMGYTYSRDPVVCRAECSVNAESGRLPAGESENLCIAARCK